MRIAFLVFLTTAALTILACIGGESESLPTPTPEREPTETPNLAATIEAGFLATQEAEASFEATVTARVEATQTAKPTPTLAPQASRTSAPQVAEPTPTPTRTPTPVSTPTPTPLPAVSPKPAPTALPTATPTQTLTPLPEVPTTPALEPLVEIERITTESEYYSQFATIRGVTVKASDQVDPAALQEASKVAAVMLDGRQDVIDCMESLDSAFAIFPRSRPVTELPEFSYLKGRADMWGQLYDDYRQIDGLGGTKDNPVSAVYEPGLIDQDYPFTQYQVAVHEFAHHVMNLCFTQQDYTLWSDLHSRAVANNQSASEDDGTPFGPGLMVNIDEFFAGLSQAYFSMHWLPTRYLEQFFPEQFQFIAEFYGPLTPMETEDPRYVRYVTSSGFSTPWTVAVGGSYDHNSLGYSIKLLPGWTVESEELYETLISIGDSIEIKITYHPLADGADADGRLEQLAQARVDEWNQWTAKWDQSEVKTFEQQLTDGHENYWIHYYGLESSHFCAINVIDYLLTTSHEGRDFGVVLRGSSCGVAEMFAVPDLEAMLRSFNP